MLIRMTNAGYVDFNTASRECQVKPRLQRHIDARAGKIDYDVVAFNSNPRNSVTNATMSLGNRRLLLRGIGRFKLSEAQDVNIIPEKGLLSIGRNRNFEFDGTIQAGKFDWKAQTLSLITKRSNLKSNAPSRFAFKLKSMESLTSEAIPSCGG